ncbi:MAG TPA: hypothetical protein VGG23_07655 [Acidimicrobiales bacterium]
MPSCPGLLDPVCQAVGGASSTVLGAGADGVLGALSNWVVGGAGWLLDQVVGVLSSTTSIDVGSSWFTTDYRAMTGIAAAIVVPVLLLSIAQSVYRQSAAVLVRSALVQLPLALVLTAVAVQLVQLSLAVTDNLCTAISAGAGANIAQALSGLAAALTSQAASGTQGIPSFVLFVGALLLAFGALALWLELLVRAAAVYVAVLFLPIGLASLAWPAISHWARRLVDTLAALILSKFVVVAILSLAVAAVGSGTQNGFSAVLGGGALLLLAVFSPFVLLRLIPAIEVGATGHLDGARHRLSSSLGPLPRNAASHALRLARSAAFTPGVPGTGEASTFDAPGSDPTTGPASAGGPSAGGPSAGASDAGSGPAATAPADGPSGVPMWEGVPAPGGDGLAGGGPDGADDRGTEGRVDGGRDGRRRQSRSPGRGPLPLWGGSPAATDDRSDGSSAEPWAVDRMGRVRVPFSLAHDDLGPVIRWAFPGDDQSGAAAAGGEEDVRGS